ncbi:hypothetical protein GCM10027051_16080 [Niabella terrae]
MRLFEILDKMNIADSENRTRTVAISTNVTEAKKVKQGGLVTVGVDAQSFSDLVGAAVGDTDYQAVLLVINMVEYNKVAAEGASIVDPENKEA